MADNFRTDVVQLATSNLLGGTVDPSAGGGVAAPEGSLYMRFVGTAGEAWIKTGAADTAWAQISTGAGGVNLNGAYDFGGPGAGRTITVSDGAVVLNQSTATNALEVNQTGAGAGVAIALATDATAQALVVTEDAVARTASMIQLTRDGAVTSGNAHVIDIDNSGTLNTALWIDQRGGNPAMQVNLITSAGNRGLLIQDWDAVNRTEEMIRLTRNASVTSLGGHGILVDTSATQAAGIWVEHNGGGDAYRASLQTGTTNQAFVATEDATARTEPMVQFARDAASVSVAAHVVDITNDGGGAAIRVDGTRAIIQFDSGGAGDPDQRAGTVDPSAGGGVAAPEGSVFMRYGAGAGQLWLKTGAAATAWTQINTGAAAGNTLNQAYNQGGAGAGRTITASANAVVITSSAADGNNVLELNKSPAATQVGNALDVTMGANADGWGVFVDAGGGTGGIRVENSVNSAAGISVALTGAATTPQAVSLSEQNAVVYATPMMNVTGGNARTSSLLRLTGQSTNHIIEILASGAGDGINVLLGTNASAQSLVVTEDTGVAYTNPSVHVLRNATGSSGDAIRAEIGNTASGNAFDAVCADTSSGHGLGVLVGNGATGHSVFLDHRGAGDAINVVLGTNVAGQALVVTEGANIYTNPMVSLTRDPVATGAAIDINFKAVGENQALTDVMLRLVNDTAATSAGSGDQFSPIFELEGRGWGGSSQAATFALQVQPVQRATNPSATLSFMSSINGAAYVEPVQMTSFGQLRVTEQAYAGNFGSFILLTAGARTGLPAAEAINVDVNTSASVEFVGGFATQRATLFRAPTYDASVGGQTIVTAATVAIDGAPAGTDTFMAITNALAFWVQGGRSRFDGIIEANAVIEANAGVTGTGPIGTTLDTLADAATIATDATAGNTFEVTLGGNRALGAPTGLKSGFRYTWIVKQPGAGGPYTLTYNAVFKWPGGTAPTLSTGANEVDKIEAVYDGTNLYATFQANFS